MPAADRSTSSGEPSPALAPHGLQSRLLATRPAFLSVTAVAVLVGRSAAHHDGVPLRPFAALATLALALIAHAGANVMNDWADALNGTDAANNERIYPFTGGSRFIQNGVLSAIQTLRFGLALLSVASVGGLWLVLTAGPALLAVGLLGILIGWGYSAPPLALNSRGLGELCVVAAFALVAVGADCVQRGMLSDTAAWAGTSYALMVANLLYVNQFPDRKADLAAGKLHWVARLPVATARWGYVALLGSSIAVVALGVATTTLPAAVAWTAPAYLIGGLAALRVLRDAGSPAKLAPAIVLTIWAAALQGILLAVVLWCL